MSLLRQIRAERWLESVCEGVAPGMGRELCQRIVARGEKQERERQRILALILEPGEAQMPQWFHDALWLARFKG